MFEAFEVDRLCGRLIVAVEFHVEAGHFAHQVVVAPSRVRHKHVLVAVARQEVEGNLERTSARNRLDAKRLCSGQKTTELEH